ncbi:MAG: hypothetical protein M1830_007933 [Pleopsidium flavum]|nr:MAG: hypothetical protein M1830_007933 [Pleopsidium flavum]
MVAPSIPGFGFSPAPEHPGLGLRDAGQGFNDLIAQLGYSNYVFEGGDFGAFTLRFMANDFPSSVRAIHTNFWFAAGNDTAEKKAYIEALDYYDKSIAGYRDIQQTRPLQLAIAMTVLVPWGSQDGYII